MRLSIAALLALPFVAMPGTGALAQGGEYVEGKKHGHWVLRSADGGVQEGPFVEGKVHGPWVLRSADGQVEEGPFVDGKRQGRWIIRESDGTSRPRDY